MVSLFVGRLPFDFEDSSLENMFIDYGNIIRCKVKRGGRFAFGFVEFEKAHNGYYAIRQMDGLNIEDVPIIVEISRQSVRHKNCYNCGEDGHFYYHCPSKYDSRFEREHDRYYSHKHSRSPNNKRENSYKRHPRSPYDTKEDRYSRPSRFPYDTAEESYPRRSRELNKIKEKSLRSPQINCRGHSKERNRIYSDSINNPHRKQRSVSEERSYGIKCSRSWLNDYRARNLKYDSSISPIKDNNRSGSPYERRSSSNKNPSSYSLSPDPNRPSNSRDFSHNERSNYRNNYGRRS